MVETGFYQLGVNPLGLLQPGMNYRIVRSDEPVQNWNNPWIGAIIYALVDYCATRRCSEWSDKSGSTGNKRFAIHCLPKQYPYESSV